MNCETFQRRLLIDPNDRDSEFRRHAEGCPGCAKALESALAFEAQLHMALSAELPSAGDVECSRSTGVPWRLIAPWLFVPLLVAAAWIGLRGIPSAGVGGGVDWQGRVIGHILDEQDHLHAADEVPAGRLRLLFSSLGANLAGDLGQVRFAGRCAMGRRDGIHLVLAGEQGPVTALFMPGEPLDSARDIGGDGLQGVLVPARFGNLAVVGAPGEQMGPAVQRLLSNVDWAG